MKTTWKKITTIFIALAMVASSFNYGFVVKAAEKATYTIYPTPQNVEYGNKTLTVSDKVNVVYEQNIDQYTKQHVKDVFAMLNKAVNETNAVVENETNVLVGIHGQEGIVNRYFKENNLVGNFDFTKYDASILDIKGNTIAILAKDTDAAFHAVTSLKHIFTQVNDNKVTELTIRDYADVKARGFIEGYYGNPWSNEDRADLMKFGGDYKLNQYIYAPKDDPKHNARWRDLYTDDELAAIKNLAEAGNRSKCYYVYALHTFMNQPVRFDSNYENDIAIIKKKFEQLMGVGVKQFAILADDAGVPGNNAENYVRLMNDMTNWMKEKAATVPGLKTDLIFCPHDYMGWGTSGEMQTLKKLPDSVSIIQTGGRVWGEVGPSFNDSFFNSMNRPAYMWINWPCSDNTKDSLIMGGAEAVLKPNVNPNTVNGIVLNPMQQSEPSKAGLFTNADYAWNIWDTASKYDTVWHDSFNYIDHGTIEDTKGSSAYRELSKHMMNSRQIGNDESVEIKEQLKQFTKDFEAGKPVLEQATALKAEFVKLQQAAKDYRAFTGNQRTLGQIIYWIDCWDDTTSAILSFLDSVIAMENQQENSLIVEAYLKGQESVEKSKTHKFKYIDHYEKAMVGRLYITPFMNKMDQLLSEKVSLLINPNKQLVKYITNREDTPDGNIKNVLDNDPNTQIIYKTPSSISKGTYVGVSYTKPVDIDHVIFRMGQKDNPADTFTKAKLEYTVDGNEWKDVTSKIYSSTANVEETNLNLKNVKGIRLTATEDVSNKWLGVKDIVVNPEEQEEIENKTTITLDKLMVRANKLTDIIDDNKGSFVHLSEDEANRGTHRDFIPKDATVTLNFSNPKTIEKIQLKQDNGTDKLYQYAIEYSADGKTNWTTLKTYEGDAQVTLTLEQPVVAKAVRVRNTKLSLQNGNKVGWWWKLYDFNVVEKAGSLKPATTKNIYTNTKSPIKSRYEEARCELVANQVVTLEKNQYIGLDLKRIKDLSSIEADVIKGNTIQLQVSKNALDWIDIKDLKEVSKLDARYIRYINKGATATIEVKNFVVNSNEISGPFLHDSTIGINSSWGVNEDSRNNGAAFDGNVETTTEFADLPQKGQYIIYDLGQERTIKKLELFAQDGAVNYIRDADIQISSNLKDWTTVVKIGDGKENTGDANITCINSDAGYKASSKYPNKVSVLGTVNPTKAHYIRIYMTAANRNRAVLFNEIMINDGEYVPVINDPTFHATEIEQQGYTPQKMFDGSLTTSYKPSTNKSGSITYTLSENLNINRINILQKSISNANVEAFIEKNGNRKWVHIGTLNKSLNEVAIDADYVLEIKISWNNGEKVNLSEIITFRDEKLKLADKDALQAAIAKTPAKDEKAYTSESWNAYKEALENAKNINLKMNATQEEVDLAKKALVNAFNKLEENPDVTPIEPSKPIINKDQLNDAIAKEPSKGKDAYTSESWKAYIEALEKAKEVSAKKDATQKEVDSAKDALISAMNALKEKEDLTPNKPELPSRPNESDQKDDETPSTGVSNNTIVLWTALLSCCGMIIALSKKRKTSK